MFARTEMQIVARKEHSQVNKRTNIQRMLEKKKK